MDVHPPLAKMLIALCGWLAGFNGDFDFKDIGKDYLEPGVPYVAMRMFPNERLSSGYAQAIDYVHVPGHGVYYSHNPLVEK